ncbi:NAD-dependent deacetylase [Drancourtella sp. An210]|nr:NAD-dependent deacetylase [Drancourtella sp. An210]
MQEKSKLDVLKEIVDQGQYVVVLCGSGMLEECGFHSLKDQNAAYEIEEKYGRSPEYLYTDAFFNTRTEMFFEFYKNEILVELEPTESVKTLAAMEKAGKLKCIITSNIYELSERGGCRNVIDLHGSIYRNKCMRCHKEYSLEYIKNAPKIPYCEDCHGVVRPGVSFFGEMLDSDKLSRTLEEIEKCDVLLLLGTSLSSEVFHNYVRCFEGSRIVVIHTKPTLMDDKADLVIYDEPRNILPELGY